MCDATKKPEFPVNSTGCFFNDSFTGICLYV